MKLWWPIRCQGDEPVLGISSLEEGGKVVGSGTARGAEKRYLASACTSSPESKECGASFINDRMQSELGMQSCQQ
jgi:hypothetical protein